MGNPRRKATDIWHPVTEPSWRPDVLGPVGLCLRCFHPQSDERAYCTHCGHLGRFFAERIEVNDERCRNHPDARARAFCVVCREPVCDRCIARQGVSLVSGLATAQCRRCVSEMEGLEASYLARIRGGNICAKHPDRRAVALCLSCGLPHCAACLFFRPKVIFWWRPGRGPYCLGCFRLTANARSRSRWISAADSRAASIVARWGTDALP